MSARERVVRDLFDEGCNVAEIAAFLQMRPRGVVRALRAFA